MHVTFATKPAMIPGNLQDWLTLDSAEFNFDNLRVIGDAGPGDPRTTATSFQLRWDTTTTPPPIDFPDAPSGLYSKVSLQIDGLVVNASYRLKGKVNLNGTWNAYDVEDHDALSLSLDIDRTLAPGGTATIGLLVNFEDALSGVDYTMLPFDDGALQLETGSPQMTTFRTKLTAGISIDGSVTN